MLQWVEKSLRSLDRNTLGYCCLPVPAVGTLELPAIFKLLHSRDGYINLWFLPIRVQFFFAAVLWDVR